LKRPKRISSQRVCKPSGVSKLTNKELEVRFKMQKENAGF